MKETMICVVLFPVQNDAIGSGNCWFKPFQPDVVIWQHRFIKC